MNPVSLILKTKPKHQVKSNKTTELGRGFVFLPHHSSQIFN